MKKFVFLSVLVVSLLIGTAIVLSSPWNYHQLGHPFRANFSDANRNMENCTGAAGCWLMMETSGSIVDSQNGITLTPDVGTLTYNVPGGGSYATGISLTSAGAGFLKDSATSELEIGTGDAHIFIVERINTPDNDPFIVTYETGCYDCGNNGFEIGWAGNAIGKSRRFRIASTDSTTVSCSWGGGGGTPTYTAFNGGDVNTYEFIVDRSADTITYKLNGAAQEDPCDISAIHGKAVTSRRLGIGTDGRGGLGRTNLTTIFFVRQING